MAHPLAKNVTWRVDDPRQDNSSLSLSCSLFPCSPVASCWLRSVASVDENGVVTGLALGETLVHGMTHRHADSC